ncbi:hypothetical protein ACF1A5_26885 [Streptomyces sp. NPDC014864]|uniref:hypothetical protein n=1 Tax=Streptomyces sp. NPDC014864 TaxID=3364924 RepID=UPI0036FF1BC4
MGRHGYGAGRRGIERPVLVVAHREVPEPLAIAPDEDEGVDWMERYTMARDFDTHWFMDYRESD